jgi:hypothetical protein
MVIGCCVALGGAVPSLAAAAGPLPASEGPISARYQAIRCDTALSGGSARVAAGRRTELVGVNPGFPPFHDHFPSHESRQTIARYQLRDVISDSPFIVSREISDRTARSTVRTCVENAIDIPSKSSKEAAAIAPTDARRLFQLAVALAAIYVLFLVAWFWGTREHRSRVGSAARY